MSKRLRSIADDRGFTMVSVMVSMMVLGMFAAASWATANGDIPLVRQDADRNRAYEAAEAGVQWYTAVLQRDSNAWAACAKNGVAGVNMQGSRASWRAVDQSSNTDEKFAIEILTQPGKNCTTSDPGTAILGTSRVLRIRSTGWANGKQRQIVTSFKRKSFLDFMYYTKWETIPPGAAASVGKDAAWWLNNCDTWRAKRSSTCTTIQFADGDAIKGPMHTEDDSVVVCNSPTFGELSDDDIEITRGSPSSWQKASGGCSANSDVKGNLVTPAGTMQPPPDNRQMKLNADIVVTGNTCLKFTGTSVDIYANQETATRWGTNRQIQCTVKTDSRALTPSTTIYVDHSGACPDSYDWYQYYQGGQNCGNAAVSGTINSGYNVTVGAANDIIVTGDLKSPSLVGLVASHYVRVYHPLNGNRSSSCTNLSGWTPVREIDAAILATTGSFITDNWDCGASLGTLTVIGTIGQYWRGTVGTGGGGGSSTGYIKDYQYDRRLRYSQPPDFLDPVGSSWKLMRTSEQVPVKSG